MSLLLVGYFALWTVADSPPSRPNILLIMTDDQGWGDVQFSQQLSPNPTNSTDRAYSGHPELKTPNLDSMRQAGMQFNRFYAAAPVCRASRASFLTGRNYQRTGISLQIPGQQSHLLNRELTIAEVAKTQGYTTGHFGKWHMGALDKSVHPLDSNIGGTDRLPSSATHYSPPWNHAYDTTFATESKTQTFNPTDISTPTHYWTGHEQSLSLTDPSLAGDDSKVIVDRVIPFIQNAAANNQPFMGTVWLHTPHLPYDTIDRATLNEYYTPSEQADTDTNEKGYYSAISAMDKQIGRMRQEIQDLGVAEDTLIVFTSDNGPWVGAPYGGNQAKGGLRGNKFDLYEGGVRVPGIIEWEGNVVANSQTDAVGGVVDLLPTMMDIWDLEMPDDRPLDGESLLPVITGSATQRNGSMKFKIRDLRSIVDVEGRYKAISTDVGSTWQLYDLIADPKETNNLSGSNPTKLSQLRAEWNTWQSQIDAQFTNEIDYDDYINTTTNVNIDASNPVSFEIGQLSDDMATVFVERQFATLNTELPVDSDGAEARYDLDNLPLGATIDAGTVVDSFLVHFDPNSTATTDLSLTFDSTILGVIGTADKLAESDSLAFANPSFDSTNNRGALIGESDDSWEISADGLTIDMTLQAMAGSLDEVRILTRSSLQFVDERVAVDFDGDFNGDSIWTDSDIDLLSAAVADKSSNPIFDLNDDGTAEEEDRRIWVEDVFGTFFGDADLNKEVAFGDFLALSSNFGLDGGWAKGDFDGNGKIAFPDFLMLSANFGKSAPASAAVPEPSGLTAMCLALLGMQAVRRQRGQ